MESRLRAYSRTLEQRVEERTTELAQTNERLEREIAEQVRAEESLQAEREEIPLPVHCDERGGLPTRDGL